MARRRRYSVVAALLAFAIISVAIVIAYPSLVGGGGRGGASRGTAYTYVGDLEIKLINGTVIKLSKFRGRKVILDFWATWCKPCLRQLEVFRVFTREHPDIVVISISVELSVEKVRKFIEHYEYTWLFAIDEGYRLSKYFGVRFIPTLVVIDENCRVKRILVGLHELEDLERIVYGT